MSGTAFGEFLRARREQLRPEDVGLAWSGRRRVPGLRREELAMLAGISADYYLRLEQGRDIRPSSPVVEALARALQLDEDATMHLHALASRRAERPRGAEPERAAAHVARRSPPRLPRRSRWLRWPAGMGITTGHRARASAGGWSRMSTPLSARTASGLV